MRFFPKTKFDYLRVAILLSIPFYLFIYPLFGLLSYKPKEGDLIFQSLPYTNLTFAIEGVTNSSLSHVGLVIKKSGDWYVREAVLPEVTDTRLIFWVMRGRAGRFAVYRLKKEYQKYIPSIIKESEKYLGKPYDLSYSLDDYKIYCSELIFKSFKDATGEELARILTYSPD